MHQENSSRSKASCPLSCGAWATLWQRGPASGTATIRSNRTREATGWGGT